MKTDTRAEAERRLDRARDNTARYASLLNDLLTVKQRARAEGLHLSSNVDRAIRRAAYWVEVNAVQFVEADREICRERKEAA